MGGCPHGGRFFVGLGGYETLSQLGIDIFLLPFPEVVVVVCAEECSPLIQRRSICQPPIDGAKTDIVSDMSLAALYELAAPKTPIEETRNFVLAINALAAAPESISELARFGGRKHRATRFVLLISERKLSRRLLDPMKSIT